MAVTTIKVMRLVALLLPALGLAAQQVPFTLDQVLGYAFPSSLAASPTGGKVTWVENTRGVRNIFVAEPPAYQARKITAYTQDDGQVDSGLIRQGRRLEGGLY